MKIVKVVEPWKKILTYIYFLSIPSRWIISVDRATQNADVEKSLCDVIPVRSFQVVTNVPLDNFNGDHDSGSACKTMLSRLWKCVQMTRS